MPFLDSTKYKNNVRTVIGTPQIYPDDVILLCDTSVGAVTINLLDIPTDYWNTQWQMFIVDKSGNASVNNITIVAGTGQVINGGANIVLNQNNAYANIRISGNGKYIATTSFGGGATINGHIIEDEGVALPQQPVLNFVGAGVTATNGVGKTTITIPGGALIIPITNANLITLVNTNAITPAAYYLVTDANFVDEGVLVTGLLTNGNTSVQGIGLYLNADYQGVGNYSGVPTFAAWKNIWYATGTYNVGDVAIYNNNHYVNLTGLVGSAPPTDLINWQFLAKSTNTGYIKATDFVYYDLLSNSVITRIDNKQNEVDLFIDSKSNNSLLVFQWGRNSTFANKVKGGSIYYNCNSYCTSQVANYCLSGGSIYDFTPNIIPGIFNGNIADAFGTYNILKNSGTIQFNNCTNSSKLEIYDLSNSTGAGTISDNQINGASEINQLTGVYDGKIISNSLDNNSVINLTGNNKTNIKTCTLSTNGNINIDQGLINSEITSCEISGGQNVNYTLFNRSVERKRVVSGYSNWDENLDFNDATIWNNALGELTIPINFSFVGIFNTLNSNTGVAVSKIINSPLNHDYTIKPDPTTQVKVFHTPVGVAVLGNMLCDASPSTNTLVGRVSGTDFVQYRKDGNFILRTNLVVVT